MGRTSFLGVLAVLALFASPLRAEKERKGLDEAKSRETIARIWIDLGTYLAARGFKTDAAEALDRARETTPDAAGTLKPLEEAVAAAADGGTADAEASVRREKAAKEAGSAWERLAETFGDASDPRFSDYLLRAAALDAAKGRIQRLADAAKRGSIVVRSPKHPMTAFLSLPSGWKPGKAYPVLVAVEGTTATFASQHAGFLRGRGSREVILVTPFSLSSMNQPLAGKYPHYSDEVLKANERKPEQVDWDDEGVLALLDLVQRHFGAEEKVAITGWSGGGMLCYAFTMRHPGRVRLCVPVAANFSPALAGSGAAVMSPGPRVRIRTGAADPYRERVGVEPGIERQTDLAVERFESLGFKDVKRTMLPGVGHTSAGTEVWTAVDEAFDAPR